jgi:hypothetical protein
MTPKKQTSYAFHDFGQVVVFLGLWYPLYEEVAALVRLKIIDTQNRTVSHRTSV